MKNKLLKIYLTICLLVICIAGYTQTTSLVSLNSDGTTLSYTANSEGSIIPDFSMVGYHNGEKAIPDVPVVITLNPGTGDRRTDIQNAINYVAGLSPDVNGHRGAVLLTAGYYEVSSTLTISTNGVVLRGEGSGTSGTILEITATSKVDLFNIGGSEDAVEVSGTEKLVTNSYVPTGSKTVTVEAGHNFQVNDRVFLKLTTNTDWITLITMDQLLSMCGPGHSNWTPRTFLYKRKVTGVNGNEITLDAPIVDPINTNYNSVSLVKYSWGSKIEECGVENIRLQSSYTSSTDENHSWYAMNFMNIENAWARNVKAYYFAGSCAYLKGGAYQVTIENCGMYEPKSLVTGQRRYAFWFHNCQLCLVKDCEGSQGRHDCAVAQWTPGPNAFVNFNAISASNDCGPHERWSTGTLFDNVSTSNSLNVRNRTCFGSGHGWAGAQTVLWNCLADQITLQDPQSAATNWAIGCSVNDGIINVGGYSTEPQNIVQSEGTPIATIPSLYEAQLKDRLNLVAPNNLTITENPTDEIIVYPNPVSDKLYVKGLSNQADIRIYNSLGQLVISRKYNSYVDVAGLQSGIYHVICTEKAKSMNRTLKIVKQ